jgi:hypothetical protein
LLLLLLLLLCLCLLLRKHLLLHHRLLLREHLLLHSPLLLLLSLLEEQKAWIDTTSARSAALLRCLLLRLGLADGIPDGSASLS